MSAVTTADARVAETGGGPVRRAKGRRWTSYVLPAYSWVVIVYLALPVFVMIAFGFNDVPGRVNAEWFGFTTRWYGELLDVPGLGASLAFSLEIALVSTLASTALGALFGLALGRYSFRGGGAANYLIFLAIASPEIVLGTSLLTMFVNAYTFIPLGFWTITVSHIMFSIAFVAVTVRARVQGLDAALEEAAQDLGANPLTTFMKVTLPLIAPGVIAGGMLSFALSIDDFVITSFVSGPSEPTFPLFVYGSTRTGTPPQVNVMGTLLFLAGVLAAVAAAAVPTIQARRDARRLAQDRTQAAEVFAAGARQ
jgi:spermidine/putrescine transport system permease protein